MSKLDMSLEDMIKMNKRPNPNPNPRDRARNAGPTRQFHDRSSNRFTPYSNVKVRAPETKWKHDMFACLEEAPAYPVREAARVSAIETGAKLLVSNLDYGVSDEDIKELFSEAGHLKRYSIDYDKSGRSKGTAEVVFSRSRDAETAVKRYNYVELDGRPIKIEFAEKTIASPAALPPATTRMYKNQNGAPRRNSNEGRGFSVGMFRVASRGIGRAPRKSRGQGVKKSAKDLVVRKNVSVEDLDAELEKYRLEAMQTN